MRIIIILILFLLVFSACSSNAALTTEPTSVSSSSTPTQLSKKDYLELGLTESEIQLWEERGIASMATAEIASALAGFKVITPGFIPSSLHLGSKYIVTDHNTALTNAGMEPKFQWIDVMLIYFREGEDKPAIMFIQSSHDFSAGMGELTDLCGRTVEKRYTKTDTETELGGIAYHWENNGIYYDLSGTFSDAVNETIMEQVLCSIINQ